MIAVLVVSVTTIYAIVISDAMMIEGDLYDDDCCDGMLVIAETMKFSMADTD